MYLRQTILRIIAGLSCASAILGTSDVEAQLFRFRSIVRTSGKCGNPNCPMCYPENFRIRSTTRSVAVGSYTPSVHVWRSKAVIATSGSAATEPLGKQGNILFPSVSDIGTPRSALDAFLELFPLRSSDVLYDLGCGEDARVLIAARQRYGCFGVGIEIVPSVADSARAAVYSAGYNQDQIRIITGDAADYELTGATHVYMYQTTPLITKFSRRIPVGPIVISALHPFPTQVQQRIELNGWKFYVRQ